MTTFTEKYQNQVKPQIAQELGLKSPMAVPKISKIVVSMGVKEGAKDKGVIEKWRNQLAAICGQLPKVNQARKSIAGFSLVKGSPIGLTVTLRGRKMMDFLEKLIRIVLPRARDFRGVPLTGFDGKGNYNLGLDEVIVFPEVDYNQVPGSRGLQVTIVTNARKDDLAQRLLTQMGVPFAKPEEAKRSRKT